MEQNRPSQEHLRDNFEESGNRELENDSNNCYVSELRPLKSNANLFS